MTSRMNKEAVTLKLDKIRLCLETFEVLNRNDHNL